jgi:hypothetical protein
MGPVVEIFSGVRRLLTTDLGVQHLLSVCLLACLELATRVSQSNIVLSRHPVNNRAPTLVVETT